jgi:Cytochrome P460
MVANRSRDPVAKRRRERRSLGVPAGALLLAAMLLGAHDSPIYLKAPGLRLKKDPSIVLPATYAYVNHSLTLPHYRNAAGDPAEGWSRKYIATRRFKSDQSAWIYYRRRDLHNCVNLNLDRPGGGACIWPGGALIVIESYRADVPDRPTQPPVEIDVMSKAVQNTPPYDRAFFAAQWSYARFTSRGDRSITGDKVRQCHQCHAIAFQLTGDAIFTRFP